MADSASNKSGPSSEFKRLTFKHFKVFVNLYSTVKCMHLCINIGSWKASFMLQFPSICYKIPGNPANTPCSLSFNLIMPSREVGPCWQGRFASLGLVLGGAGCLACFVTTPQSHALSIDIGSEQRPYLLITGIYIVPSSYATIFIFTCTLSVF